MIAAVAAACVWSTTFGTATCGRPVETTSATALPVATCVPAAGFWLMTEPAGTVVLDAVVIVPTVRPAPVIAAVAAACVRLTTFGTATCGRPVETTSATALPVATCVPAVGFWLITDAGRDRRARCGRDRADRQARARDRGRRRRLRLADDVRHRHLRLAGRDDQRDRAAGRHLRARRGVWLITDPAGTVVLDAVVTVPTVRPAPVIAAVAAACVWPTTFGIATCDSTEFTISMAARFHMSVVGEVSFKVVSVPDRRQRPCATAPRRCRRPRSRRTRAPSSGRASVRAMAAIESCRQRRQRARARRGQRDGRSA